MIGVAAAADPRTASKNGTKAETRRLRVMQMTDWLEPGGKERVTVNIANLLPRDRFDSFLCTTRPSAGVLDRSVAADVRRLRLDRVRTVDWTAVRRLVGFNEAQGIDVVHAHGSSVFMAAIASMFPPYPAIVWHDHYGPYRSDDRPVWLYRLIANRVNGVIAVNRPLLEWSRNRLGIPSDRTWYLPNFSCDPEVAGLDQPLPGASGHRLACVAHLRPQKDHPTLLSAFAGVIRNVPDAHLLLIGGVSDSTYAATLQQRIAELGLASSVTWLGQRDDVPSVLAQCDVGVLSSASEGFPLALIEYGQAGLASVATHVGECPEVLDQGRAGILVPAGDPAQLTQALTQLLLRRDRRRALGEALRDRVNTLYRSGPIVEQICQVYQTVTAQRA